MEFRLLLWILLLGIVFSIKKNKVPLVVFGVDGYGWELYNKHGKSCDQQHVIPLKPVFPSYSFPNLYSIVTGLYPTQHRIINAGFYNQKVNQTFQSESDQGDGVIWFGGEPIWVTAAKAGLRTYTDMWVGSTAQYDGIRPTFWKSFNKSRTVTDTISDMISNFVSKEKCDLYVLYSPQPDADLHFNNISSVKTLSAILKKTEHLISALKDRLDGTEQTYNLVVVSDHGMSYFKSGLIAEEILTEVPKRYEGSKLFGMTSGFLYLPRDANSEQVSEDLNEYFADKDLKGLHAVSSSNLDSDLQFCGLEREGRPEVMILAEDQVVINTYNGRVYSGHGYHSNKTNMLGMLRLYGSHFTDDSAASSQPVSITEIYNLLCRLLDVPPAPNVGHVHTFDKFLKFPYDEEQWKNFTQLDPPCGNSRSNCSLYDTILLCFMILYSAR